MVYFRQQKHINFLEINYPWERVHSLSLSFPPPPPVFRIHSSGGVYQFCVRMLQCFHLPGLSASLCRMENVNFESHCSSQSNARLSAGSFHAQSKRTLQSHTAEILCVQRAHLQQKLMALITI